MPEVTDRIRARSHPELAVLSAVAHGQDEDAGRAARIADVAVDVSLGLDEDRSRLYFDLVVASLSEDARRELRAMDPAKYEYQSEWVKEWLAQGKAEGKAEGRAEGRAELLIRLLTLRFGPLGDETLARLRSSSVDELDAIGERLMTAQSLGETME